MMTYSQKEMSMRLARWALALALMVFVVGRVSAEETTAAVKGDTTSTDSTANSAKEAVDEQWLNTIWTQVDDMVKQEESKLQETVTVAGVRGAEAEDQILDKLYYKGATRYPSQDKLRKAISTLTQAIESNPEGDDVAMQKYFVAQCYSKLGEVSRAKEFYTQVTKHHAGTAWAKKAQQEMNALAPE